MLISVLLASAHGLPLMICRSGEKPGLRVSLERVVRGEVHGEGRQYFCHFNPKGVCKRSSQRSCHVCLEGEGTSEKPVRKGCLYLAALEPWSRRFLGHELCF